MWEEVAGGAMHFVGNEAVPQEALVSFGKNKRKKVNKF
jgi:hypothetical protein